MSELTLEGFWAALEGTPGTPVDPPTHHLNMVAKITPRQKRARPDESRGHLAEFSRSKVVKQWSDWEGEGPLDLYTLPLWLRSILKGSVTPTTPGGATNARLWSFPPTMTSDDLEALTLYWGDPNVQVLQASYALPEQLNIKFDAAGDEVATMSASGRAWFPAKDPPNSYPSQLNAPLIAPGHMQLWLDTATIGTTAITGRVLGGEFNLPTTGVSRKWWAVGPGGTLNPGGSGRGKRHAELTVRFEVPDMTQYDQFVAGSTIKARVRLNGPLIEGALYHYVQFDIYGPWEAFDWGDNESTNRTIEMTIWTEYDTTAAHDFQILVQNDRATL